MSPEVEPGRVIADRYKLLRPLGQGGMATVWRAEHVELGNEIAIKLIADEIISKPTALQRFKREATGTFWLSETPEVVGSVGWDAALPRIATWLRLREWDTDREVLWLNTHFDHVGGRAGDAPRFLAKGRYLFQDADDRPVGGDVRRDRRQADLRSRIPVRPGGLRVIVGPDRTDRLHHAGHRDAPRLHRRERPPV